MQYMLDYLTENCFFLAIFLPLWGIVSFFAIRDSVRKKYLFWPFLKAVLIVLYFSIFPLIFIGPTAAMTCDAITHHTVEETIVVAGFDGDNRTDWIISGKTKYVIQEEDLERNDIRIGDRLHIVSSKCAHFIFEVENLDD